MTSPVPRETITLNATELKQTIIKALLSSINHHYYLTVVQKKFTMLSKYDETELTIMYHNYMTSASKKQDYVLLSGCLLFSNKQKFQHFLKNFGTEFLINIYIMRRRGRLAPHQPLSVCALLPASREEQASTASWKPRPPFEAAEMD